MLVDGTPQRSPSMSKLTAAGMTGLHFSPVLSLALASRIQLDASTVNSVLARSRIFIESFTVSIHSIPLKGDRKPVQRWLSVPVLGYPKTAYAYPTGLERACEAIQSVYKYPTMRYRQLVEHSSSFKTWFSASKVVDKKGNPLIVYHGTDANFETFLPLSHFGTAKAANGRLSSKRNIYGASADGQHVMPVYLSIQNPLRIADAEASDESVLLRASIAGRYPQLDRDLLRSAGSIEAAEEAGYDGFVYRNRMEDQGQDSWVAFRSEQVRSALGV